MVSMVSGTFRYMARLTQPDIWRIFPSSPPLAPYGDVDYTVITLRARKHTHVVSSSILSVARKLTFRRAAPATST